MNYDKIIGEKYRIIKILGQGGTSVVYLAENIVLNNLWAVKAFSKSSQWFASDMKEITILKSLSHPMLPRIVDLLEDSSATYIVMDYIPGINLHDYVQMYGKVDEDKLLLWTKDLLEVLAYLHGRNPPIIYRDMKPSNLILDDNERIRLVDFGTALFRHEETPEDTAYIGTQGYAAPEQYGLGQSDARTDLFNLGMTLIHLATGIHPLKIEEASLERILKQSGISLKTIRFLLRLTRTDADQRPFDSSEALQELEAINRFGRLFKRGSMKVLKGEYKSVIGITSISPNSGLTSLCIMIASCLKKRGFRIAIAELNSSGDFSRLCDSFEVTDSLKCKNESYFEALGISFFPDIKEACQLSKKKFDLILLDLGFLKDDSVLRELNRADIKLILCPAAVWKFPRIFEVQERFQLFQDDWIYSICSPNRDEEQMLKKDYRLHSAVTFPLPVSPFSISREDEKRIGSAMEQIFHLSGKQFTFSGRRFF